MSAWLDAHPYVWPALAAIFAVICVASSSYARGRLEDPELSAARRLKEEQRNRVRMHHGRPHDDRMAEDHE